MSRSAHAAVEDYYRCNDSTSEEKGNKKVENVKWTRPLHGWYKINCDAAVDAKNGKMGVGLILRDHNGGIIAAGSFMLKGWLDPTTTEAMATVKAT